NDLVPSGTGRMRGIDGEDARVRRAFVRRHVEAVVEDRDVVERVVSDGERSPRSVPLPRVAKIQVVARPAVRGAASQPVPVDRELRALEGRRIAELVDDDAVLARIVADAVELDRLPTRALRHRDARVDGQPGVV